MTMRVTPAFLVHAEAEFSARLQKVVSLVSHVHVDVMDGIFVPNTTWADPVALDSLLPATITYEAHFMVVDPLRACARWKDASKLSRMIFHIETVHALRSLLDVVPKKKEFWLACNPETSYEKIQKTLRFADGILIMGVHPGFSAQAFEPNTLEKIRQIRSAQPKLHIAVDGGVDENTAPLLREAGADELVSASYLFSQTNIEKTIHYLEHV